MRLVLALSIPNGLKTDRLNLAISPPTVIMSAQSASPPAEDSPSPSSTSNPPAGTSSATSPSSAAATPDPPSATYTCQWEGCSKSLPDPELLYNHLCNDHVGRKSTNNLCLTCAWKDCGTTCAKRDHITSHLRGACHPRGSAFFTDPAPKSTHLSNHTRARYAQSRSNVPRT